MSLARRPLRARRVGSSNIFATFEVRWAVIRMFLYVLTFLQW
jgi:hypothetical protein